MSHALRLESRVRKGINFGGDLWRLVGETGRNVIEDCFLKETGFGICEGVLGPFPPCATGLEEHLLGSRVRSCIAVLMETSRKRFRG